MDFVTVNGGAAGQPAEVGAGGMGEACCAEKEKGSELKNLFFSLNYH